MSEYDEKTDHALDVVSVKYATRLLQTAETADDWEDYPEIGFLDFREVIDRVVKLGGEGPTDEEYKAVADAVLALIGRAS